VAPCNLHLNILRLFREQSGGAQVEPQRVKGVSVIVILFRFRLGNMLVVRPEMGGG